MEDTSSTSSFSKFTEEFKQLACKVHDQFYQGIINLYEGFNEMQELYNSLSISLMSSTTIIKEEGKAPKLMIMS